MKKKILHFLPLCFSKFLTSFMVSLIKKCMFWPILCVEANTIKVHSFLSQLIYSCHHNDQKLIIPTEFKLTTSYSVITLVMRITNVVGLTLPGPMSIGNIIKASQNTISILCGFIQISNSL